MESRSETAMARECHLKAPLANTSSNKDMPPHPPQRFPPTRNQAFKCMSLRPFSFKLPQRGSGCSGQKRGFLNLFSMSGVATACGCPWQLCKPKVTLFQ